MSRFNQKASSRDAIIIQDGNIYKGDSKFMWVPVNRAESKPVKKLDDSDAAHSLKVEEHTSAEGIVNNSGETSSAVGLGSVQKKVVCIKKDGSKDRKSVV